MNFRRDLLTFIEEWFRGPTHVSIMCMREFGLLVGDMDVKKGFKRDSLTFEGFKLLYLPMLSKRFRDSNIFMGVGYWCSDDYEPVLENMLYDRLVYDLDSPDNPDLPIKYALNYAKDIKDLYGTDIIIVESGFKGVHIYVPLSRSISWSEYSNLWKYMINHMSTTMQGFIDNNVLQYNRLMRIPLTINYKGGLRKYARIIYPQKYSWRGFKWHTLEPLNVDNIRLYKVSIDLPTIAYVGGVKSSQQRLKIEWIEKLIEKGVPDGRRRLLAYAIIPYLTNILSLDEDEVLRRVREFISSSCRNFKNCSEISEYEITYNVKRIKKLGVKPIRTEKLVKDHNELYKILREVGVLT